MSMQSTLAAAIANAEKWQAENAHDDSSPPAPQLTSVVAEDLPGDNANDETTEQPVRQLVQVKGLDEKAVLVQVKRRMYSPYKLDEAESRAYGAGNVNKHLFEGRDNRVKQAISKYTEVYTFVKDNTVPWTTGVDMLNINNYFDFTSGLRELMDAAEAAVNDLVTHWDAEVAADLNRLGQIAYSKGKPNLANPDDYPTAQEVREKFSIEARYMPVPTTGDFRVGISDEDKESLQKQLDEAEVGAATHVISQMLEPMKRAVDKLAVPIGETGSIFRDTLIDNMVEVADRMRRVNISDDPVIRERISDLTSLVSTYANNKDMLRSSQSVRDKAATQINDLVGKMAGLM